VRKGDTLYSIALDFGHDYRDLAAWNNLANASYIQIGQRLRLLPPRGWTNAARTAPAATGADAGSKDTPRVSAPTFADPKAYRSAYSEQAINDMRRILAGEVETAVVAAAPAKPEPAPAPAASTARPRSSPAPAKPAATAAPSAADEALKWEWPAPGDLLYGFAKGPIKKGVGIKGQPGQPVVSSAPGKVVYSGSGLRGYGNLLIVKHNATYLSVYAHNRQLLVTEGQMVAQGQKIAEMGEISSGQTGLHFEIRRLGQPMDPLKYLPARRS
jgi:lipoprotein NlpD